LFWAAEPKAVATADQPDILSKPHSHDPSGAASHWLRGFSKEHRIEARRIRSRSLQLSRSQG